MTGYIMADGSRRGNALRKNCILYEIELNHGRILNCNSRGHRVLFSLSCCDLCVLDEMFYC